MNGAIEFAGAVRSYVAFYLVQCPVCEQSRVVHFLKQMLSKDNQVLDIDYAISPGHRADVTQGIVFTPVVNHNAHVGRIDNAITVEVNDWAD